MNDRVRADLEFFRREQTEWVVRDPLNRRCYYLHEEEYFLLIAINKNQNFSEIQNQYESHFAPRKLSAIEFQSLLTDWKLKSLLVCDPLQLEQLIKANGQKQKNKPSVWQSINPLFIRFRGWDPQNFMQKLATSLGWLFSSGFLGCCVLLFIVAGMIAFSHSSQIISEAVELPVLFQPQHWVMILFLIAATKIMHEFGHAIACHRFGGRCHEMGVMLLAFVPCLYCNVTDAWTFPKKYQRLAVSAAGIIVDVWIASLCIILWSITQPGLLHSACLLLAIFGSINSIFLNGNPLMRYDGYYILSDILNIPNLRITSTQQAKTIFWRFLFGKNQAVDQHRISPALALFGFASGIYLWVVIVLILIGIHFTLKPFGLEIFAMLLGLIIIPAQLFSVLNRLKRDAMNEFKKRGKKKYRTIFAGAFSFAMLLILLLTPFSRRVPAFGILRPASQQVFVIDNPGFVHRANFSNEIVKPGQKILQLQNRDLEQKLMALKTEYKTYAAKSQAIQKKRILFDNSAEYLKVLDKMLASTKQHQHELQNQIHSLTLVATHAGELVLEPYFLEAAWNALEQKENSISRNLNPFDKENRGSLLNRGTQIGAIADNNRCDVLVAIEDCWAKKIHVGADVLVYTVDQPGDPVHGVLREISDTFQNSTFNQFQSTEEEQLCSFISQQPGSKTKKYLLAIVTINQKPESPLCYYQINQVRIKTTNGSLWNRFQDYLARTLIQF